MALFILNDEYIKNLIFKIVADYDILDEASKKQFNVSITKNITKNNEE